MLNILLEIPAQLAAKEGTHIFQDPEFIKNNRKVRTEFMQRSVEDGTAYFKSKKHSERQRERIASGASQRERIMKQLKEMKSDGVDIDKTTWNNKPYMRPGRIGWDHIQKYLPDFETILQSQG